MNKLLAMFGFRGPEDFLESVMRINLSQLLIPASLIGSFVEQYFGLNLACMVILFCLLLMELVTGVWAAMRRKEKISSAKLQRFGIKLFVWFFLLMLFHVFSRFYGDGAGAMIYSGIHSFLVMYIIGVYTVSVLENVNSISGGDSDIQAIIVKIKDKLLK